MALVKMLVTDFAISHTIQNQLNPGQVTSFCFPYTRMYIYEYTSIYDYLYRLNVPKMCLWINIAHTPRWAAASVPIERPSGEHAKVDFNCNAIIMSHGLPSFPPLLPFSFSCPRRHFRFFSRIVLPSVCLPLTWAAHSRQLVTRLACVTWLLMLLLLAFFFCFLWVYHYWSSEGAGKYRCSWLWLN